jgi:hypothetical protein
MTVPTSRHIWGRPAALFFVTSFILHLAWEILQMPLYALPPASFWENVQMCLFATATGDMAFMLTLYLAIAAVHEDLWWVGNKNRYWHIATWVVPVLVGSLLAVCFELWAVYVVHRWDYASMPLVPVLRVGVTPLLQMIVLPVVTLGICWRIAARRTR